MGEFTVACSFKSVADNYLCAFAVLYGPNVDND